jgi:hypothetical protein
MPRSVLALAVALTALPAAAAIPEPPGISRNLRASAQEEPAFVLSANGIHLYECKPRATDPNAYSWYFVVPDATLRDSGGERARHAAVNQWDSTSDRSTVSGVLTAMQPTTPGNLPWALIRAIPGAADGMFAGVTSIQRVNTSGGVAPATGCDAASAGSEVRVNFSADYYFYKRRGTG